MNCTVARESIFHHLRANEIVATPSFEGKNFYVRTDAPDPTGDERAKLLSIVDTQNTPIASYGYEQLQDLSGLCIVPKPEVAHFSRLSFSSNPSGYYSFLAGEPRAKANTSVEVQFVRDVQVHPEGEPNNTRTESQRVGLDCTGAGAESLIALAQTVWSADGGV